MPAKASKYTLGTKDILIDLEVPSGAVCQVRRPGPLQLMKEGLFDNIDVLGSLVQTDHIDRVNGRSTKSSSQAAHLAQIKALIADKDKLDQAADLIDKVTCSVVVQPKIHMPELNPEARDPDKVYADNVDFEDKVFIFQFVVGGTADLASFRAELNAAVAGVEAVQDLQGGLA